MNYLRNFHKCPMCSTVLKENEVYLNILCMHLIIYICKSSINTLISH